MTKTIYLAGGCFWGVEAYFSQLKGVVATEVGYANGNLKNPTYQDLISGVATHAEVVKVIYQLDLEILLAHFFRFVDPFSYHQQGADIGQQYRSGIYYVAIEDVPIIQQTIKKLEATFGKKSQVEVIKLFNYTKAEEYHQNYLKKNKNGYCHVDLTLLKEEERK